MYLECNECGKLLNLPDNKLPIGKQFSFVCPYCKGKNTAHIETIPDDIPEEPLNDHNYMAKSSSSAQQSGTANTPKEATGIAPDQTRLPDSSNQQTPNQPMPKQAEAPQQAQMPPAAATPQQSSAQQQPQAQAQTIPKQAETQQQAQMPPATATPQQSSTQQQPQAQTQTMMPQQPKKTSASASVIAPHNDDDDGMHYISPDAEERPKALIVHDDIETSEKLIERLSLMGLESVLAVNVRDAAKQIKINKFELMLLQEDYYGATLQGNQLLRAIQSLDSHKRRGMMIILISPTITTLDDFRAFTLSLDAIINSKDLMSMLERTILSTKGRAKKFYNAYLEILAELGYDH